MPSAAQGPVVVRSWAGTLRAGLGRPSFAVPVSKRTAKTAVGRNYLRRRVYEALRLSLKPERPLRAVLYPTEAALTRPFADLQKAVDDMLGEAWSKLAR